MAGNTKTVEHIAGVKPKYPKGEVKHDFLLRRGCTCIGDHPVSWTLSLGSGFTGFLVPLKSDSECPEERLNEVLDLLSTLIDQGYDYVPPGSLSGLKNPISTSLLIGSNKSSISLDRFDIAVPLRRACEGCRCYFSWDSKTHDWQLRQFQNVQNLRITGYNVLLIAYKKPSRNRNHLDGLDDFSDLIGDTDS